MYRRKTTLSVEDRKAVDIILDHAARAGNVTRFSAGVPPQRIAAITRLLHVLDEMPAIDPPKGLVARTMERIDRDVATRTARPPQISVTPGAAHLH